MHFSELVSHVDMLQRLDTEPLVDYLHKHGVFSTEVAQQILSNECQSEKTHLLLEAIGNHGSNHEATNSTIDDGEYPQSLNACGLFINALRHTGYHRLASLLDNERRIIPAIRRGSKTSMLGYHTRPRHRGQIAVIVQVSAVKVSGIQYGLRKPGPHQDNSNSLCTNDKYLGCSPKMDACSEENFEDTNYCWIGMTDLKPVTVNGASSELKSQNSPEVPLGTGEEKRSKKKSRMSCFLCLCCPFAKIKSRKLPPSVAYHAQGVASERNDNELHYTDIQRADCKQDGEVLSVDTISAKGDEVFEQLEMKADILNTKSEMFYKLLQDTSTASHECLLKYFEQQMGVLVLDSFHDEAFVIVVICTEYAKLESLKCAQADGSLARKLEKLLLSKDIIQSLCVKQMKLGVAIDEDEYNQARVELQSK